MSVRYSSFLFFMGFLTQCAQADKFSLDASNPMALLGQISWSVSHTPVNSGAGVTGTQFVAVGEGCSSWISEDGISWKYSSTRFPGCNTGGSVRGVVYGNGTWIAVGTLDAPNTCGIWSSQDDALSWSLHACDPGLVNSVPTVKALYGIAFGANQFWAIGGHNAAGTGSDYFGQRSSDGIHWQYFGVTDGSTYILADYYNTVSYNAADSKVYFSGVHSVNYEFATLELPSFTDTPVNLSMSSSNNQVMALKSGQVMVYGDNDYLNPTSSNVKIFSSATLDSSAVSASQTAIQVHASIAVEGKDRILLFGNSCSMDYYQFGLNVWHPSSGSVVSGCSSKNLLGAAYNSVLDRYVVTGTSNFFAYSTSGLPSAWTAVVPSLGGESARNANAVASKQ
ncbi:hypothetical protein [Leptospira kmetyi]|uniref:Galactose oxidase n=1 Tax=Leptospira kmetyi TaxID=408139 RepID=A0ABX4N760_9LEPT|nr:hypothetical protein [Leptospira kmetyi]PJZ29156.1 hypothetical protein CH378_14115 [Leptospira kmetyi]